MIYFRTEHDMMKTGLNITKTPRGIYFAFVLLGLKNHYQCCFRYDRTLGHWSYYTTKLNIEACKKAMEQMLNG